MIGLKGVTCKILTRQTLVRETWTQLKWAGSHEKGEEELEGSEVSNMKPES